MAKVIENEKSNKPRPKPEPHPVAALLRDTIGEQIIEFLKASPEERATLCDTLFKIEKFPSGLAGCEGAENYNVFQMERSARMYKDKPDEIPRMSTAIVLIDKTTNKPAFYLYGYITPKATAFMHIYCMDDKGTDYRKTVHWSSRDYGF